MVYSNGFFSSSWVFLFFLLGLLTVNPFERLSIDGVLSHRWLQGDRPTPSLTKAVPTRGIPPFPVDGTAPGIVRPNILYMGSRKRFKLNDVEHAPLVKRRRFKRRSMSSDSSSTGSEGLSSGEGIQLLWSKPWHPAWNCHAINLTNFIPMAIDFNFQSIIDRFSIANTPPPSNPVISRQSVPETRVWKKREIYFCVYKIPLKYSSTPLKLIFVLAFSFYLRSNTPIPLACKAPSSYLVSWNILWPLRTPCVSFFLHINMFSSLSYITFCFLVSSASSVNLTSP